MTYLSLDLDFWNYLPADVARRDIKKVLSIFPDVPKIAVMNHQQLLPFINDSRARHLINVDTHSDLATEDCNILGCGTWVSYVNWRTQGTYTWYHRLELSMGDCADKRIFRERCTLKFETDWKSLHRKRVKIFPKKLYEGTYEGIGLVLSPEYSDKELFPVFREIVKTYNIKYVKGTMNESRSRYMLTRRFKIKDAV
jgi:hypothetical protein